MVNFYLPLFSLIGILFSTLVIQFEVPHIHPIRVRLRFDGMVKRILEGGAWVTGMIRSNEFDTEAHTAYMAPWLQEKNRDDSGRGVAHDAINLESNIDFFPGGTAILNRVSSSPSSVEKPNAGGPSEPVATAAGGIVTDPDRLPSDLEVVRTTPSETLWERLKAAVVRIMTEVLELPPLIWVGVLLVYFGLFGLPFTKERDSEHSDHVDPACMLLDEKVVPFTSAAGHALSPSPIAATVVRPLSATAGSVIATDEHFPSDLPDAAIDIVSEREPSQGERFPDPAILASAPPFLDHREGPHRDRSPNDGLTVTPQHATRSVRASRLPDGKPHPAYPPIQVDSVTTSSSHPIPPRVSPGISSVTVSFATPNPVQVRQLAHPKVAQQVLIPPHSNYTGCQEYTAAPSDTADMCDTVHPSTSGDPTPSHNTVPDLVARFGGKAAESEKKGTPAEQVVGSTSRTSRRVSLPAPQPKPITPEREHPSAQGARARPSSPLQAVGARVADYEAKVAKQRGAALKTAGTYVTPGTRRSSISVRPGSTSAALVQLDRNITGVMPAPEKAKGTPGRSAPETKGPGEGRAEGEENDAGTAGQWRRKSAPERTSRWQEI